MFKLAEKEKKKANRKLVVSDFDFPFSNSTSTNNNSVIMQQSPPSSSCCSCVKCQSSSSSPPNSHHRNHQNHYLSNGLWLDHAYKFNEHFVVQHDDGDGSSSSGELGLCQNLCRLNLQDEPTKSKMSLQGFVDANAPALNLNQTYSCFDGSKTGLSPGFDYGGLGSCFKNSFDIGIKSPILGFGLRDNRYESHDPMGSPYNNNIAKSIPFNEFCSSPTSHLNGGGAAFVGSQQYGLDLSRGVVDPFSSSLLMHPKLNMNVNANVNGNSMFSSGSTGLLKDRTGFKPNIAVSQPVMSLSGAEELDAFSCEQSFIFPEKSLNQVISKRGEMSGGFKKNVVKESVKQSGQKKSSKKGVFYGDDNLVSFSSLTFPSNFTSLGTGQGHLCSMAKDQYGCRFLQRLCDEGTPEDVQMIFNEIIVYVVPLMLEPFGNYLVQKLIDVCSQDQMTQIVFMVTKVPGQLVRISLNTYGTRVVQKLIENLKTRQQVVSVRLAIQPGFLHLIKDLNGNHVIQRCLQCLSNEDNKFIFDAAAKFCVEMATHQHGCCVLQRCIGYATGENREKLISEVCFHGLHLAQDQYGNYVIQFIIDQKNPSANAKLHAQFKGNYVHLSMQKFSSHVVEKCLKTIVEMRPRILHELLSIPHFEQLLQDPYANYVIQSALKVTKGPLHDFLVQSVRPHRVLRTNPYSKRIFSRSLLKK